MARPQVVIVGGGFGGLACARKLDGEQVDVLLVDTHNYHLFTPLLYQVATALLNAPDIAYPFRKIFRRSRNVRFHQAYVTGVDFASRRLSTHTGEVIPYEYLVIATGSTNDYYGNRQIADSTLGMKTLGEAQRLRNHVLSSLERAAQEPDAEMRRHWLTFVVVGGGPTGVEYAGALNELLRLVLGRDYPELTLAESSILLVEGQDRLLGAFDKRLGAYAQRQLERRGVEVRTGTLVRGASPDRVELSSGETIPTQTVVWSAGVRPFDPAGPEIARSRTARLDVDERLRVPGRPEVFAIGDAASVVAGSSELPMLSPPAMQEGRYVARLIAGAVGGRAIDSAKPFRYVDKGTMATIGRNAAVVQLGRLRLRGLLGWATWLTVHLWYIVGFRNRLAVFTRWGWTYVRKDRPIRLIMRVEPDQVTDELVADLEDRELEIERKVPVSATHEVVFLFDVDNTLLDNDRVTADLRAFLDREVGADRTAEYFEIFEALRSELGYADYLGALQRYRERHPHESHVLRVSSFLIDYPFANRLYPQSLDVVERVGELGPAVILSDGDAVFQQRKIERSGLMEAVDGHVLVYIHKERELGDVRRRYPANRYVLVDDKLRILAAVKDAWGELVTTVFPRQGHYAHDPEILAQYPAADVSVDRIGELMKVELGSLV